MENSVTFLFALESQHALHSFLIFHEILIDSLIWLRESRAPPYNNLYNNLSAFFSFCLLLRIPFILFPWSLQLIRTIYFIFGPPLSLYWFFSPVKFLFPILSQALCIFSKSSCSSSILIFLPIQRNPFIPGDLLQGAFYPLAYVWTDYFLGFLHNCLPRPSLLCSSGLNLQFPESHVFLFGFTFSFNWNMSSNYFPKKSIWKINFTIFHTSESTVIMPSWLINTPAV